MLTRVVEVNTHTLYTSNTNYSHTHIYIFPPHSVHNVQGGEMKKEEGAKERGMVERREEKEERKKEVRWWTEGG